MASDVNSVLEPHILYPAQRAIRLELCVTQISAQFYADHVKVAGMSGFTGPSQTHGFSALVMNVYSTEAIRQHWTRLAKILDVDVETVLHKTHGRRSIDGIGLIKPEMANWECTWWSI